MKKKVQSLFGYEMMPAWGCYEVTEGYSFMIQSDGNAIYNRFVMSGRQLGSETIQIESDIVNELKKYLLERKSIIKNLPESTDNGSLDGCYDTFTFMGKSLTCLNAEIHNSEEDYIKFTRNTAKFMKGLGTITSESTRQMLQAESAAVRIFLGGINILKKSSHRFSAQSWEELGNW